jgi:hypothetical protein
VTAGAEPGTTYEVTVAGPLGPVLRAACGIDSSRTVAAGTRLRVGQGRSLPELVAILDEAGVRVQGVFTLHADGSRLTQDGRCPPSGADLDSGMSSRPEETPMTEHTDQTAEDLPELGPVDYLVLEFPGSRMTGEGLPLLVDLVDRGIIRILDLVFVTRGEDGSVTVMEIADFDADGTLDLAVFQGASSGLLDEDDVAEAAGVVAPGSSAGILIYENTWAAPLAAALRRGGAELVASGRISADALMDAVEAAETRDGASV